jgi:hypothetical protein
MVEHHIRSTLRPRQQRHVATSTRKPMSYVPNGLPPM